MLSFLLDNPMRVLTAISIDSWSLGRCYSTLNILGMLAGSTCRICRPAPCATAATDQSHWYSLDPDIECWNFTCDGRGDKTRCTRLSHPWVSICSLQMETGLSLIPMQAEPSSRSEQEDAFESCGKEAVCPEQQPTRARKSSLKRPPTGPKCWMRES